MKATAYVDGSFNPNTNVFGFAASLQIQNGETLYLNGKSNDKKVVSSRNIAGEVLAVWRVLELARKLSVTEIDIFYDYNGIEYWATGEWQAKKPISIFYKDVINNFSDIKMNFIHVKSHTGNHGNEFVDFLAKKGCDVIGDDEIIKLCEKYS